MRKLGLREVNILTSHKYEAVFLLWSPLPVVLYCLAQGLALFCAADFVTHWVWCQVSLHSCLPITGLSESRNSNN